MTSDALARRFVYLRAKAEQWEVFTFVHSGPSAGQVTECATSAKNWKEDRAITEIGGLDNDQLTIDSINNLIKKTEAKEAALHPKQQLRSWSFISRIGVVLWSVL
jgi:hypothetical protein